MTSCGGSEPTLRTRNAATTCYADQAAKTAAVAQGEETLRQAEADVSGANVDEWTAELAAAEQERAAAQTAVTTAYTQKDQLVRDYIDGKVSVLDYTTRLDILIKDIKRATDLYNSLAIRVSSARVGVETSSQRLASRDKAKADLAAVQDLPLCDGDVVAESSTTSVVDESTTTSVVVESSTTSVVEESSTTSQPGTDTTISTDSTTTSVAPVTSDTASCEISDLTAPSQVAVGEEFEVSARFTGARCLEAAAHPAGLVNTNIIVGGSNLRLLSSSCPARACEGVIAMKVRALSAGSGSVAAVFFDGEKEISRIEAQVSVVSQSTTTSVAGGQNSGNNDAETSTTAAESAALCKFSKPTAPSQVVVGEPFDITIDSSSEYCSDRLYVVFSGFAGEVRATAIFSGPKYKTFSMMIMGPGLVTFQMYYRAPESNRKLAEVQVASVESAKQDDVDPCGKVGVDTPNMLGTSTGLEVSAACDAADGLEIKVSNRQGDVLLKRVAPQHRQLKVTDLDYLLQRHGYLLVEARHLCSGRTHCGYWVGVELEQSSIDEKSATTTTTTVAAESTTTTSTSVTATSTESTLAAETTTTSVAPTTTTSSVPELVTPTVDSPTGQQPSTVVPVGLFSKADEGSPAAETEVTKIAVDETAVILICDQTCVDDVAAQTGADPQDLGAIEVRVGDGDWQPALGSILPLVDGRTKVQFRGTPAGGAAVVLAAEFYNEGTPIENVNTIDTEGNITNANGEVVGSVPIYDVADTGFAVAAWMWLLFGFSVLALLAFFLLQWRKRMSALTDNGSTGDRSEQK